MEAIFEGGRGMRRRTLFKKAMQGVGLASVGLARAGIAEAIPQAAGAADHRAENESARAVGGSYRRIKSYLDSIPAVDLHEHLRAFDQLVAHIEKGSSHGPGLDGIWGTSYLSRIARL